MNKEMGVIQKMHHLKISQTHNEKVETLLQRIKEVEPLARVNKQMIVELGVQMLTENDVLSLARESINKKALVLEYLKKDKNLSNPDELIALIKGQSLPS